MKITIILTMALCLRAGANDENALLQMQAEAEPGTGLSYLGREFFSSNPIGDIALDDIKQQRDSKADEIAMAKCGGEEECEWLNTPKYAGHQTVPLTNPVFPLPAQRENGADVVMSRCEPDTYHSHYASQEHRFNDGTIGQMEWAALTIQKWASTHTAKKYAARVGEGRQMVKAHAAKLGGPPPYLDDPLSNEEYVTKIDPKKGYRDAPCQRCIEESDPGVFGRDIDMWNTVPSGFQLPRLHGDEKQKQADLIHHAFVDGVNGRWGKGHMCCRRLDARDIEQQPLCGICLRFHAGGLGGQWSFNRQCAKVYCEPDGVADGLGTKVTIDRDYMKDLARECGPLKELQGEDVLEMRNALCPDGMLSCSDDNVQELAQYFGKKAIGNPVEGRKDGEGSVFPMGLLGKESTAEYPTTYLAVVANNPRKKDLSIVFQDNQKVLLHSLQERITGTGSSSAQCAKDLGEPNMKGAASTTSGPFGGDVQCGGILAEDHLRKRPCGKMTGCDIDPLPPSIAGLIFLNDEREPHRLDIIALKQQLLYALHENELSLHEHSWRGRWSTPSDVIDHVARQRNAQLGQPAWDEVPGAVDVSGYDPEQTDEDLARLTTYFDANNPFSALAHVS